MTTETTDFEPEIEMQTFTDVHSTATDGNESLPIDSRTFTEASLSSRTISALPPVDRGRQAWTYLCTAFIFEAILWGIPLSYGVFHPYYSTHPPFSLDQSLVPLIGTISTGLTYCNGFWMFPFMDRFPKYRKLCMWIGLFILCLGYLAASFAQRSWQLVLTQGVMTSMGVSLTYVPTVTWLSEWFVQKRGLAGQFFSYHYQKSI